MLSQFNESEPFPSVSLAVIILTLNEEKNLAYALDSVRGWASEVFVVDSQSTDDTAEIARRYKCTFVQHKFEDYSKQRNWALNALPVSSEWILFLDADEWLTTSLKDEISSLIISQPTSNGYLVKFRLIWMGKWIRRGYHSTWLLRLFRHRKARCECRAVNEHIIVDGQVGRLQHDLIHEDRKGMAAWTRKHIEYAQREAALLSVCGTSEQLPVRLLGSPAERMRWLRVRVYNPLPPLVRPVLYFLYRAVFRGGLLDGPKAWIYHFLHALWVPLLIDCFYLETRREMLRKKI